MFPLSGSPSRESWPYSQPYSYLLPIGRSHCVPKLCLNRLQYHLPLSLNDHPCLQCPGLAPALCQGCPSWADRGQASQLGNVHVVAT